MKTLSGTKKFFSLLVGVILVLTTLSGCNISLEEILTDPPDPNCGIQQVEAIEAQAVNLVEQPTEANRIGGVWPGGQILVDMKSVEKLTRSMKNFVTTSIGNYNSISGTSLQFAEWDGISEHYISFTEEWGQCSSPVGFSGGQHVIKLGYCQDLENVMHEFFHILGFDHEHNRDDRDLKINIDWSNLTYDGRLAFNPRRIFADPRGDYDIHSISHYPSYSGGNIACDTSKPIFTMVDGSSWPKKREISSEYPNSLLSKGDIWAIRTHYPHATK